jgi:hypothetical protein
LPQPGATRRVFSCQSSGCCQSRTQNAHKKSEKRKERRKKKKEFDVDYKCLPKSLKVVPPMGVAFLGAHICQTVMATCDESGRSEYLTGKTTHSSHLPSSSEVRWGVRTCNVSGLFSANIWQVMKSSDPRLLSCFCFVFSSFLLKCAIRKREIEVENEHERLAKEWILEQRAELLCGPAAFDVTQFQSHIDFHIA